jgi:hypothetical protein
MYPANTLPVARPAPDLTSCAANAETIAGRASVIDADILQINGERIGILDKGAPESRQKCKASADRNGSVASGGRTSWRRRSKEVRR